MIKIKKVQGRCLFMDGLTCTIPYPGMTLPTRGPDRVYILMTGPNGRMELSLNHRVIRMRPDSIARICGTRAPELAKRPGAWDQARLIIGKVWAKMKGPESLEKIVGNVAVGVRG